MIFRLPDMLKNAIKSAHYLSILLPVCWLLWAWHRGGAITLALHFPLAAAGFLMLNNAFAMPLSAIYSQRYDAEPRHFSGVPLVGESKNGGRATIGWMCRLGFCCRRWWHLG